MILSWEAIIFRLDYVSSVKSSKLNYDRIIATYSFKETSAMCGVNNCLQAHAQGFLVATSKGKATAMCDGCGKIIFNIFFDDQCKRFQKRARMNKQKVLLNKTLEQKSAIKARINTIKQEHKRANWPYRVLTDFTQPYPTDLLVALITLATDKANNTIVAGLVEKNPAQLQTIQSLQGLAIFSEDIREELIGKILKPLKDLELLTGAPDNNLSLGLYCQWVDGLEAQFTRVEYLIGEGRTFFTKVNLERLKSIPLPEVSARLVQSLCWNIDPDKITET